MLVLSCPVLISLILGTAPVSLPPWKRLCALGAQAEGRNGAAVSCSPHLPSPVLQYSLQEMLRKLRVMEFMKFKLCFNGNVFSISASLGAWD